MPLFDDLPQQNAPDDLDRFAETQTKREERPKANLDIVKRAAAKKLAPAVVMWLKADGEEAGEDEITDELAAVIDDHVDGYTIARKLDYAGWSPDDELVDILGRAWHEVYEVHKRLVQGWVKTHGIVLDLPVGTPVTTRRGRGKIAAHQADTATYLVYMPDKGDVEVGHGTRGTYFAAEEVSAISPDV